MRRHLIAASIVLAACASAGPPPGGPEDRAPPRLMRVTPDTNAVNVGARAAVFFFDETINDRGTDAQDLTNMFLVSPSDGTPRVSYHRSRIEVRPRRGFRPNTAYTVTLLPGLSDLRSNTMKSGASVVFSTGATIPSLRITGIAFDWVAGVPAPRALIEAMTPDSVMYLAQADSAGRFVVGPLDPGTYLVRATLDQNNNRRADRGESFDSLRVTAPQSAPVELLAASRDTLEARLVTVSLSDSVTLRLTFDRLLDPAQQFPLTNFRVAGADSVSVPVTAVRTPREEAALALARQRQAADSARRADSLAGRPQPTPPAVTPPAAQDSTPKPSRPAPFTTLALTLARPLAPNTPYRARVTTVRALSGRETGSERSFVTPRPAPPRPPADSTAPRGAPPPARP
ncbi:MAG TPA: Ig-like domain-containing protein [Gemmatimonadaceae bacterium]|nr:Ig-like domain-containing protein [Gemmatimonadaceae bacterium]